MKYLMLISLFLVLNTILIQSLRMKFTPIKDCTSYVLKIFCVADYKCQWGTSCQIKPQKMGKIEGVELATGRVTNSPRGTTQNSRSGKPLP